MMATTDKDESLKTSELGYDLGHEVGYKLGFANGFQEGYKEAMDDCRNSGMWAR